MSVGLFWCRGMRGDFIEVRLCSRYAHVMLTLVALLPLCRCPLAPPRPPALRHTACTRTQNCLLSLLSR